MKYGTTIAFATLLVLASCRHATTNQPEEKTAEKPAKTAEAKRNIIKKHISIPSDFSYITNLGSVDIVYTQGNYSVDVEGDSVMLEYLETNFDCNLLTVSIKSDSNTDINFYGNVSHVKMYVSCPDLKCVSICGNGSFESEATWSTDDLQLGVMGSGFMKIGKVECTTFSLQSTNVGNTSISELHAEDATIYANSSASIDVDMDVKNLTLVNEGTQPIKLTGMATNVFIKNPKDPHLTNELEKRL